MNSNFASFGGGKGSLAGDGVEEGEMSWGNWSSPQPTRILRQLGENPPEQNMTIDLGPNSMAMNPQPSMTTMTWIQVAAFARAGNANIYEFGLYRMASPNCRIKHFEMTHERGTTVIEIGEPGTTTHYSFDWPVMEFAVRVVTAVESAHDVYGGSYDANINQEVYTRIPYGPTPPGAAIAPLGSGAVGLKQEHVGYTQIGCNAALQCPTPTEYVPQSSSYVPLAVRIMSTL